MAWFTGERMSASASLASFISDVGVICKLHCDVGVICKLHCGVGVICSGKVKGHGDDINKNDKSLI